jgi:hypothetical protein
LVLTAQLVAALAEYGIVPLRVVQADQAAEVAIVVTEYLEIDLESPEDRVLLDKDFLAVVA